MPRLVVLLRGVNLVSRNRVSMPELREALGAAGFEDVVTYVQSGNVVVSTGHRPGRVAEEVRALIADRFGLEIGVVVRSRPELARVLARDPLAAVVADPKRYLVTFLDGRPDPAAVAGLERAAAGDERVVHVGRELYTWHPAGAGRSKLARLLSSERLGVTATSRNWTTVTRLLELAGG